ncbi:MAG: DUF4388 domain-containing protein [Polyangiaceae bacterium]
MSVDPNLVVVEETGEAHPQGKEALRRMRSRAGDYQLLPSPNQVLLMRSVSSPRAGEVDPGPRVRLVGEINGRGALCDILEFLGQVGWRGRLLVSDYVHVRVLLLENGNVVGVKTNAPDERLGQVLFRFGILGQAELDEVMRACRRGVRFSEAATRVGGLEDGVVYEYIGHQIREVVAATLTISSGAFSFLDEFDDDSLTTGHAVSVSALLSEAATRMDEAEYFRQSIPSKLHVPARRRDTAPADEQARQVFKRVNGQRSVEELGRLTGIGAFETTKALYAMVRSGHVAIRAPRVPGGEAAIVEKANDALRTIFEGARLAGKEPELRRNLGSFIQSMGVYPVLLDGAGPGPDGELDVSRVVENLRRVPTADHPENVLKDLLHQLVSFALFTAGASVGARREGPLKRSISQTMRALRPSG